MIILVLVEVIGIINDFPGEYDLAYTLTDSSGNRAQAVTRTVIVENLAPVGIRLEDNQTEENQPVGTLWVSLVRLIRMIQKGVFIPTNCWRMRTLVWLFSL